MCIRDRTGRHVRQLDRGVRHIDGLPRRSFVIGGLQVRECKIHPRVSLSLIHIYVGVEAIESRDLHADHIVENAVLAHELAEARADGGPEELPCAALVDGELHLAHLAHADAGAVVLNGKAAEERCV